MAYDEAQRNFRRLKLDITGWQVLPSKEDVEATGIPVPAAQILGRTGNRNLQVNTVIPEEDELSHELRHGDYGYVADGSASASILFESQILVEDGQEEPVIQPMSVYGKSPKNSRLMLQGLADAPTGNDGTEDTSHRPETNDNSHQDDSSPYRKGEPRWPLLQATTDELAEESRQPGKSLLSRDSTASHHSPVLEGITSPGYFFDDHSHPSSIASSPVQFPSLNDSGIFSNPRIREGQRRRNTQRPGSLRRQSRRSSARSSVARSPAGSFLAQFSKSSAPPEPDEDGQTLGDFGEYIIGKQIGYGGFSVIKEIYSLENQRQVMRAVKIVRKHVSNKNDEENEKLQSEFGNEVSIWRLLKHEHILPLVAVFTNTFATFCIMGMSTGGTLFDLVRSSRRKSSVTISPRSNNPEEPVPEPGIPIKTVQHYLRQLASAIQYLHQDMLVVHRDIKLENCLVSTQRTDLEQDPEMKLLLCDFGMADFITAEEREDDVFEHVYCGQVDPTTDDARSAHIIGPSDLSTNIAGSLEYASPELIRASRPLYAPSIDIWAFGVLSHALLTQDLPFRHSLQSKVQMMILEGLWDRQRLASACTDNTSGSDLVEQCLQMDPEHRWTINDVVGSVFLA